ncbi:MAG: ABC transporter ATP-binding protein, partial [Bifidobacteriaceae bacterium]|nr:ABC transporter ATP-binding protein [Bifidobacteriaceae bacterium]
SKGELITVITSDIELLEIFFAHTVTPVVIAIVTSFIFVVTACVWNWQIGLLLLFSHIVVGVIIPVMFAQSVRLYGTKIRKASAAIDDVMLDDMRGIDEIVRFNQGKARGNAMLRYSRTLSASRVKLSSRNGLYTAITLTSIMLLTSIALFIAARTAMYNPYGLDTNLMVIFLFTSSFAPTVALSALPANLTQTFAAARRVFNLIDEKPSVTEEGTQKPAYNGMSMKNVSFTYEHLGSSEDDEGQHHVLNDFSLSISKQGILGIQGKSGRGKSTIVKLLMRYWDPQEGSVEFSDTALPQVDASYRRAQQSMMSQETYLFNRSIKDNLLIANPDASEDDMRMALQKASVWDLVQSLPEGLDTQLGELGSRLSEGERQRIGLARLFIRRDVSIMFFDEPTSRLDSLNESVILSSIQHLRDENVVVVLISHRMSTMNIADSVVQM